MNWVWTPRRIAWPLLLLLVVGVVLASAEESHSNRRSGSKGRKRGRTTTTTTTTTESSAFAFQNDTSGSFFDDNAEASAQHQQDQPPGGVETCEVARLKCAYRVGCGMALQNYMVGCSDVITGASQRCSDHCRNSLIALTSTEEGEALMKCKCGDSFCKESKQRINICRSAVLRATNNSTTVSCSVAQWICVADPLCSTALDYYNRFCRSMFAGKKCTLRCKNSISILRRQEKAAKLSTCVCDGTEDYDCPSILDNMDRLCYHKVRPSTPTTTAASVVPHHQQTTVEGGGLGVEERNDTTIVTSSSGSSSEHDRAGHGGHHPGHQPHHPRTRPHHPHYPPHVTEDIETNEVELHPHHRHPPNRVSNSGATSSLTTVGLRSLFVMAIASTAMYLLRY